MNEKELQLLNKLAEKIKSRRLQLNLSQEALADKCGLDRTYCANLAFFIENIRTLLSILFDNISYHIKNLFFLRF